MSDKTGTENRISPKEHNTLAADVQNKTNEDLLMEIEKILEQGENMDTALLEHYLDILQERDPVETGFNPEAMWNQLEDEHPLLFEESEKRHHPNIRKSSRFPISIRDAVCFDLLRSLSRPYSFLWCPQTRLESTLLKLSSIGRVILFRCTAIRLV